MDKRPKQRLFAPLGWRHFCVNRPAVMRTLSYVDLPVMVTAAEPTWRTCMIGLLVDVRDGHMSGLSNTSTTARTLNVSECMHGNALRLIVSGEIDLASAAEFHSALSNASSRTLGALVIDLRGVTFFGVAGLSCLVELVRSNTLITIAIVANTHAARRPIELIGTDPDLAVFGRVDDALRFVGAYG